MTIFRVKPRKRRGPVKYRWYCNGGRRTLLGSWSDWAACKGCGKWTTEAKAKKNGRAHASRCAHGGEPNIERR